MTQAQDHLSDLTPVGAVPENPDVAGRLAAARFRRMFDDHFRVVLGYALRRCSTPADAADVAADVFLTAWRRIEDVPTDDALPWLIGTARGAVANLRRGHLRRHRLADRLRDDLLVNPPISPPAPDVAPVSAAMSRLSNGDRELLRLIAWEGLTPIQIAVLDDVPASTIRSRLRRARARLAAALAAERDGPNRAAPPPAAPRTRSASVAFTDPEDFR